MADYVPKLGELVREGDARDAIHIAVVPVVVARGMSPGEHVGVVIPFGSDGPLVDSLMEERDFIGIIDPFLKARVKRGQRCWMMLYPGSVIGLRHQYRHPVLDHEEIKRETIEKLSGASRKFITQCATEIGLDYDEIMKCAAQWLATGEEVNHDPSMSSTFNFDQFWGHYEIVTGTKVRDDQKQDFFTCCM